MSDSPETLPVPANRGVTLRDFLVFQLKLVLDGLRDVVVINCSIVAIIIDLANGRWHRPRLFYVVVRFSQRFEDWLRLHHMKGMDMGAQEATLVDDMLDHGPDADELIAGLEDLARREFPPRRRDR